MRSQSRRRREIGIGVRAVHICLRCPADNHCSCAGSGANQLSEEIVLDCIFKGHLEVQKIIRAQHAMFRERGMSKIQ